MAAGVVTGLVLYMGTGGLRRVQVVAVVPLALAAVRVALLSF